jgi:hypothetical protein
VVAEAAESADRESSGQLGAVQDTVPEGSPAPIDPLSDGEAPDAGDALESALVLLESPSEAIERSQERRRRRRKSLPIPPAPTFIKVGPGKYVRAEEPPPPSNVPPQEGGDEGEAEAVPGETIRAMALP